MPEEWKVKPIKKPGKDFLNLLLFVYGQLQADNRETFTASDAQDYGGLWVSQLPKGPDRDSRNRTISGWFGSALKSGYLMRRQSQTDKRAYEYAFSEEFLRKYARSSHEGD